MLPIILAIRDEEDRNFVADVYIEYSDKLQAIARKYLHNHMDVEDCVQDVVILLIDYLEDYRSWDEKHRQNFLVKCCRCVAINKYNYSKRKQKNEFNMSELSDDKVFEIADEDSCVEKLFVSEENQRKLRQAIDDMDPIYSDVLYFKAFLGMKNIEIAKTLNVSSAVINTRLMRARRMLLAAIGD